MGRIARVFAVTIALTSMWFILGTNRAGRLGADPLTGCVGDCNNDGQMTVDEILAMVNLALNGGVTGCAAGDANMDNQITVDEILTAVNNALNGCNSIPTPTPITTPGATAGSFGPIQITTTIFNNVLPQIGTMLPSVDTFVSTALTQGLDPFLENIVAAQPMILTKLPNGVQVDFGNGMPQPVGTLAGKLTATYSNVTKNGNSISFDGIISTENLTLNGAGYPITNLNINVNATQMPGGTSTETIMVNGSGTNPPSTTTGNIQVDTARCATYPVGGMITTTIGGQSATIRFNDKCNGTFGFSSSAETVNWLLVYYNCYYENWYDETVFILTEKGHLGDDLSDDEPPNVSVSGTLSDTEVNMRWELKCKTPGCQRTLRLDGTFVGHLWKEEDHSDFGLSYKTRYYIGTYTTHYAKYDDDNTTLICEATRVLTDEDGMNGYYHFIEIRYGAGG